MNFSSFDYFLALARERSYTRAADVLRITQQSLSAAIAAPVSYTHLTLPTILRV